MSEESRTKMMFDQMAISDRSENFGDSLSMDDNLAFEAYEASITISRGELDRFTKQSPTATRIAKSLLRFRSQANEKYPNRSKVSDGAYGDAAHCPNPDGTGKSDHCPNIIDGEYRVVTAFDLTHDPENECDCTIIVESVRASKDSRVKYIIWNKKICYSRKIGENDPWEWLEYSGKNNHTKHSHISVKSESAAYDDETDWTLEPVIPA